MSRSPFAALILTGSILLSCSGGGGKGADPGPAEHVLVTDATGVPMVGRPVLVSDAEGEVVALLETGADGTVDTQIPAGGFVSAFFDFGGLYFHFLTFLDVPEGGTAKFVDYPTPAPTATPAATTTLSITASGAPGATDTYTYHSRCDAIFGTGATSMALTNANCPGSNTEDVLALAYDNATTSFVAWGTNFDFPITPGNTVAVPVTVNQTSFLTCTLETTNIPATATQVGSSLYPRITGRSLYSPQFSLNSGIGSTFSSAVQLPALSYETFTVQQSFRIQGAGGYSVVQRRRQEPSFAATYGFDASSMSLVTANVPDVADPIRPTLEWTTAGSSLGQSGYLNIAYTASNYVSWFATFASDHAPTTIRFPDLPPELADWQTTAVTTFGDLVVGYEANPAITGYGEVTAGTVANEADVTTTYSFHDAPP